MESKISLIIVVNFDSKEASKLVHDSLIPEFMDHDFDRSQVSIELDGFQITINIKSQDISAARANINSIMRWVSLVTKSVQLIPKTTVKRYS
jgi:tRNA threonylcarbamoyladenosine modification (KEOPS) complex  Pcc1 subunit